MSSHYIIAACRHHLSDSSVRLSPAAAAGRAAPHPGSYDDTLDTVDRYAATYTTLLRGEPRREHLHRGKRETFLVDQIKFSQTPLKCVVSCPKCWRGGWPLQWLLRTRQPPVGYIFSYILFQILVGDVQPSKHPVLLHKQDQAPHRSHHRQPRRAGPQGRVS